MEQRYLHPHLVGWRWIEPVRCEGVMDAILALWRDGAIVGAIETGQVDEHALVLAKGMLAVNSYRWPDDRLLEPLTPDKLLGLGLDGVKKLYWVGAFLLVTEGYEFGTVTVPAMRYIGAIPGRSAIQYELVFNILSGPLLCAAHNETHFPHSILRVTRIVPDSDYETLDWMYGWMQLPCGCECAFVMCVKIARDVPHRVVFST